MKTLTLNEKRLWDAIRELELRLSVLERLPVPIVFAIGKYPDYIQADMQAPSELEH